MTDPITQAREIVSGMTPGPWFESPDGPGDAIRGPRAEPVHDTTYVTIANLNDQSLGDPLPAEANAAGIILATNLLRTLTSDGAEEALADELLARFTFNRPACLAIAQVVRTHLLAQAIGEG